jgi:lipoyl(octanoyl) transferase
MLQMQREQREAIARGEAPNTLYLLEHEPVFTCGRDFHQENLLLAPELLKARGIEVTETDRGGDVTYHGPGQLVAYPLLNLSEWQCSVGWYLRTLEQVIIDLLAEWNLEGYRVEGLTGVWVAGAKVAAVGVGIHRWITFHGVAINVHPNLDHFGLIIPCGISDKPVTSLERLLPKCPDFDTVAARFEAHFRRVFECGT